MWGVPITLSRTLHIFSGKNSILWETDGSGIYEAGGISHSDKLSEPPAGPAIEEGRLWELE